MSDGAGDDGEDIKRPTMVKCHGEPKLLLDGFFRVSEYRVSYGTYAGGNERPSPQLPRIVADRGHSVAALLYNPELRQVVLVEQFRLPTYGGLQGNTDSGWILETPAGKIAKKETAIDCLIREVREETGYAVKDAYEIATFYPSPGATSERITLFLAEVSEYQRQGTDNIRTNDKTLEKPHDYEDIKVCHVPLDDFLRMLEQRKLVDAKLIIAAYFLKDRIAHSDRVIPKGRSGPTRFVVERSETKNPLTIGIRPGDMRDWNDIRLWVNSENTDMEMDRFYAKSVSGMIRYYGAERTVEGRVTRDFIADSLRRQRGRHGHVDIGGVIETDAGRLSQYGVEKILHVAAVEGRVGTGKVQFDPKDLEKCVGAVLARVDHLNAHRTDKDAFDAILVPMLGAGQGGGSIEDVARLIVERCMTYLLAKRDNEARGERARGLRAIWLSAYSDRVEAALKRVLATRPELEGQETPDAQR